MRHLRWTLGPEVDGSTRLFRALARLGFRATEDWSYPRLSAPFNVTLTDGDVEVLAEFETPEGVVVSGPEEAVLRIRSEYDAPSDSPTTP